MGNSDLRELTEEINEIKLDIQGELKKRDHRTKIKRVENAHLLVALGIFGAFTSGISTQFVGQTLKSSFQYIGWASIIFLSLKLTTLSVRPVLLSNSNSRVKDIIVSVDDRILPILFIILLYGAISIVILEQFPELQRVISEIISIEILFTLQLIGLAILGYQYSNKYKSTMAIESSSPEDIRIFPTGTSGSKLNFTVQNPGTSPLPSGDIEFHIDPPDGISIKNVHPAHQEGGVWVNSYIIPPGEPMKFNIEISADDSEISNEETEIPIEIKRDGSILSEENIPFEV